MRRDAIVGATVIAQVDSSFSSLLCHFALDTLHTLNTLDTLNTLHT